MKICLIEDSKSLIFTLKTLLKAEKYVVRSFEDPIEAIKEAATEEFDLFIVDVNLPNLDGYETAKRVRKYHTDTPILFLTVRDELSDKIKGFEAGGDDYLTKPFETEELLARIKALLKRKAIKRTEKLSVAGLDIDIDQRKVTYQDKEIPLSVIELQILEYLAQNHGQTIDKDRIANRIWEDPYEMSPNLVAMYISKLRKKMLDYTGEERIVTSRGFGYRLG
jgi:DNA-binding response OmpR family regulator